VKRVYVLPGNGGSFLLGKKCVGVPEIGSIREIERIRDFVEKNGVDLTFVGPEAPLSLGIVDLFKDRGLPVIGPTKKQAILETSKCWTKDYLRSIGVPVPDYRNFDDPEEGKEYVEDFYSEHPGKNLVVKADGVSEGKGTFVCNSVEDALNAIDIITGEEFNERYNDAGRRFEVEERLYGHELSFFVLADGKNVVYFGTAKDYKRAFEKDDHPLIKRFFDGMNPNTGGMGSYSPEPVGEKLKDVIMEKIAKPIVKNFKYGYRGIIHLVLMKEGGEEVPKVLEINVRDGDPEAQSRLPRLRSDMYEVSEAVLKGGLDELNLEWDPKSYVAVCAVSGPMWKDSGGVRGIICGGYPGEHYTKQPIYVIPHEDPKRYRYPLQIKKFGVRAGRDMNKYLDENLLVFHNGTIFGEDGYLETSGGRVLTVVGNGETPAEARDMAYRELEKIWFNSMRYREDIGE
ncbi:MAG: phosphoribosylamine--glycine ligase, partial [Candidatus Aenigmatarchaeota archaeon]